MKHIYLLIPLLCASLGASAQTPTWATDVAPIIYNKCASCHRNGGIAPFNLLSYTDAINNASKVKAAVEDGIMPPWPPDPSYNRLAHERLLSTAEKNKILNWLNGGRPRGDVSLEPPTPVFSNNGDLPGTPDMVLKIPTYTSTATTNDVYRCFVLPTGLTADKFITAFECIPGDRSMVHHVVVFTDTTGQSTTLDAGDPGPGYTSFGSIGVPSAEMVGGWVPGMSPAVYPNGFGLRLSKNAKVVLQIHYPKGTSGMKDSTELHLFFSPVNTLRRLYMQPVLNHEVNINAPLNIPANTVKEFTESQFVPVDLTVFGVTPHMHYLGKKINVFGVGPTGDTQRVISIPDWDFHWQGTYMLRKAMKIAAGTTAYSNATYDNTTNNPDNPSSPPKNVSAGEQTTDEMMITFILFTYYQAGDENIVIDGTTPADLAVLQPYYKGATLLESYPVPANKTLVVKYHMDQATTGSLVLINDVGQIVKRFVSEQKLNTGYTALPVDVSDLPAGNYTLQLTVPGATKSQRISIVH
jgi:hypothetical protein